MAKRLQLIVLGIMGRTPLAGVAWQVLHYLEGFRRLGFDVYYVEDTEAWPYDPEQNTISDDCSYAVGHINSLLSWCGLSDRWSYRSAGGETFGLSESQVVRLFERSDALVNLTGATVLRREHLRVPVRIYLETDPVLPQIEVAKGNKFYIQMLEAHTHHFTYGENLGAPDCGVPVGRFDYHPTRQPVVLDWWRHQPHSFRPPNSRSFDGRFTTIASWRQSGKDFELNGDTYTWSKHHEFLKFIDLPRRTVQRLELALAIRGNKREEDGSWAPLRGEDAQAVELLKSQGWQITDALILSKDIFQYRDYILGSRGEFTVAKDQNVRLGSGWFSDRSACYLAAGRPVITQDTKFAKFLPTGEGLFSFNTMDEIIAAFDAINSDYARHSRSAGSIAEEYFRAETVLAKIVQDTGL